MNAPYMKILLILIAVLLVGSAAIRLIKRILNKSDKASKCMTVPPKDSPYIALEYIRDGGIFEDGKCGWLDIECEDGESRSYKLDFNKKSPVPMYIPLKVARYRISYRTKSKAGMVASGVLKTINESSGAMGAFANAVYDAGVGSGELSSVVLDASADFVMKLGCSTNGIDKHCKVIS